MSEDVTFKIINVGKDRLNRLNDRFVRYLLTGSQNKVFLITFINEALFLKDDDKIIDLEFIPDGLHGPDSKTKLSILDASAKLVDGRTVDVEVQVIDYHDFRKRGPYYWSKRHALKLEKGAKVTYAMIKPTITICLLAFDLLEEEEEYRNSYSIRNDKSGNRLCADMQILYLELPKFLRFLGANHPRTGLERWLLYFSNEVSERMEKAMAEDGVLSMARDVELSFWADEVERELYFQHQQLLMDTYSAEHTYEFLLQQERERTAEAERAKEEAERAKEEVERAREESKRKEKVAQGALQKALEQGRKIALEMALNLRERGMERDQIVQILQASGFSEEDIRGHI